MHTHTHTPSGTVGIRARTDAKILELPLIFDTAKSFRHKGEEFKFALQLLDEGGFICSVGTVEETLIGVDGESEADEHMTLRLNVDGNRLWRLYAPSISSRM